MNIRNKKLLQKKENGFLTIDFIFSILAVYAISMVFVLLAFSLMFSTITQYIAFSVSRAHISGDISREDQFEAGTDKFQDLMAQPGIRKLMTDKDGGWFKAEIKGFAADIIPDFGVSKGGGRQEGYGVHIEYTSNILKNKLPLIGSPSDGGDDDFAKANIYSFLYREPTATECLKFNESRWEVLKERFPNINLMNIDDSKAYGKTADNGC